MNYKQIIFPNIKITKDMILGKVESRKPRGQHVYVKYDDIIFGISRSDRCVIDNYLVQYHKRLPKKGDYVLFIRHDPLYDPDAHIIAYTPNNIRLRTGLFFRSCHNILNKLRECVTGGKYE